MKDGLTLKEAFKKARKEKHSLGAFNVGDLSTLKAVSQAVQKFGSPAIIEVSPGEAEFIGIKNLISLVKNLRREFKIPLYVNLDHAKSVPEIKKAIRAGFDLVHFDGSDLSLEENICITKEIVKLAHSRGVLVEGEIDKILGSSQKNEESSEKLQAAGTYTNPEKAAYFVEKTDVDIFSVFIGNIHGVYNETKKLDLDRLKLISNRLPCFLSLHGGSGTTKEELKKVINIGGVVKININSDLRIAYRQALEESLSIEKSPAVYKIMEPVIKSVKDVVLEKMEILKNEQ